MILILPCCDKLVKQKNGGSERIRTERSEVPFEPHRFTDKLILRLPEGVAEARGFEPPRRLTRPHDFEIRNHPLLPLLRQTTLNSYVFSRTFVCWRKKWCNPFLPVLNYKRPNRPWRKREDSNLRDACAPIRFRGGPLQPLGHASTYNSTTVSPIFQSDYYFSLLLPRPLLGEGVGGGVEKSPHP